MTDSLSLERGYRRILACYPRAFRQESEEEILAVLMATARDGQRRVGLAEAADLIRGALRMHRGPRLPRTLLNAVRRTYAGAALELAVLITLLVTLAGLTSASIRQHPDFSAAQWHAVLSPISSRLRPARRSCWDCGSGWPARTPGGITRAGSGSGWSKSSSPLALSPRRPQL